MSRFGPDAEEVARFHDNDDVDGSQLAHHHTLGGGHNQAAPGDHNHDARNDERYMRLSDTQMGVVQITGSGVGTTASASVVFDPPFETVPIVFVSNNHSRFTSAATDVSATGFTAGIREISAATFTDIVDVRWVAFVG